MHREKFNLVTLFAWLADGFNCTADVITRCYDELPQRSKNTITEAERMFGTGMCLGAALRDHVTN